MRVRSIVFALAASLAVVRAQVDLSQIPACALPCLVAAIAASGCSTTDYNCQCTTGAAKIQASLSSCVPSKCSASDIAKLSSATAQICASVSVTASNLQITSAPVASATSVIASSIRVITTASGLLSLASAPVASSTSSIASSFQTASGPSSLASAPTDRSGTATRIPSSSIPTSSTSSSLPVSTKKNGLNKGAIAGLVVGVLILLALLGAGVIFFIQRHKKRARATALANRPAAADEFTNEQPGLIATDATAAIGAEKGYEHNEKVVTTSTHHPATYPTLPPQPGFNELSSESFPVNSTREMDSAPIPAYVENAGPYYPEAYTAPISLEEARAARLGELETSQRQREERLARMKQISAMEEEHARVQAEINALREQRR